MAGEMSVQRDPGGPWFAQVPERLLYDPDISSTAVRVYAVLLRKGDSPDNCFPGHAWIGERIGKAERSVKRPIDELVAAGWITKQRRRNRHGGYTSNGYTIHGEPHRAQERGGSTTAQKDAVATAQKDAVAGAHENAMATARKDATKESHLHPQPDEREPEVVTPSSTASTQALALVGEAPVDPLVGFDHFWDAWPKRNGKKIAKGDAQKQWARLSYAEKKAAYRGALNYDLACKAGSQGAMDAFRWLRDRRWEDWQTPPEMSAPAAAQTRAERSRANTVEALAPYITDTEF